MTFPLQDFLGRTWRNELVGFPLSGADLKSAQGGKALLAPDGASVPYQLTGSGKSLRLHFLADLDPFETRVYSFGSGAASTDTDLEVVEEETAVRISNSRTGIIIRKSLTAGQGPIDGIELASGLIVGTSRIDGEPPQSYSATVTARGPVYAEVLCRGDWGEGRFWEMRFRLQAGEPVILVDESFSLGDESALRLLLSNRGFEPDRLLYRAGTACPRARVGTLLTDDAQAGFTLEPWLHWSEREHQGTWFGAYNEADSDLLAIATRDADVWIDPKATTPQSSAQLALTHSDTFLELSLPLRGGRRAWMIAALDKAACLEGADQATYDRAPLPQQLQIKHGTHPLNRIKDYVLDWDAKKDTHPHLFLQQADVTTLRQTFMAEPAKLESCRSADLRGAGIQQLDGPLGYYLGTGDEALGKHLAQVVVEQVQETVDFYLAEGAKLTLGFAPHNNTEIIPAMGLADVILGSDLLSPEEAKRLRAQIAFLGYTINRADCWDTSRGFAANPNMTSTVAAMRMAVGSTIPSHKMAKSWVAGAMAEFKYELAAWSDDNGGWIEAPHYAVVAFDSILGALVMASNAGLSQDLYSATMKKIVLWFANICTPRDSRLSNHRHLPPLGNTYMREPTGLFGALAFMWRKRDPKFAAQLQWLHQENGSPTMPGLGGFFPGMAGFRDLLIAPDLEPRAPAFASILFPETGVILRNHYGSDRENYLHLIAGDNHAHYDADSGSVTLWGKGRLISDDWGYWNAMPGEDASMVTSPMVGESLSMHVRQFSKGNKLDYVQGIKPGGWRRQIAFVKSEDALGPNFWVLRDSLRVQPGFPATWRMWFIAERIDYAPHGATVIGTEDVDTDIFFVRAGEVHLTTEAKTRQTWGITNGVYDRAYTTQTGLIAQSTWGEGFTVLIYPRLKGTPTPTVTALDEGRVLRVQSEAGTDTVFLNAMPFAWKGEGIDFLGTVGAVQMRGKTTSVSLGADGRIKAGSKSSTKGALPVVPDPSAPVNILDNGDFEWGVQTVFTDGSPSEKLKVCLHKGKPSTGYCAAFELQGAQQNGANASLQGWVMVDPAKTYRIRLKAHTPDALTARFSGYASQTGTGGVPLAGSNGNLFEWRIDFDGPSERWQTLETTLGPEGSKAAFGWPSTTQLISLNVGLRAEPRTPATLYLDEVAIEEVG